MTNRPALTAGLNQYPSTTRGEAPHCRDFAGVAGAGPAMAGVAVASIIYSGVQTINVAINPATQATASGIVGVSDTPPLDIDGGGADINLTAVGYGTLTAGGAAK